MFSGFSILQPSDNGASQYNDMLVLCTGWLGPNLTDLKNLLHQARSNFNLGYGGQPENTISH